MTEHRQCKDDNPKTVLRKFPEVNYRICDDCSHLEPFQGGILIEHD